MSTEINVGIGEIKVARNSLLLTARGLGSCVGVAMYDPLLKLGGMAHILLPEGTEQDRNGNPYKYANWAIPELIELLRRESGNPQRFCVKLAGGARMFSFSTSNPDGDIGSQNIKHTVRLLQELGLKVSAQDTGGNKGRTVSLDTTTGTLMVRVLGQGAVEI